MSYILKHKLWGVQRANEQYKFTITINKINLFSSSQSGPTMSAIQNLSSVCGLRVSSHLNVLTKTHRGLPSLDKALDKERVIHKYMSEEDMSWISQPHSLTYSKKDFQSPKRVALSISQVPFLDQPWAFNTFSSSHAWRGTRKGIKHWRPRRPFHTKCGTKKVQNYMFTKRAKLILEGLSVKHIYSSTIDGAVHILVGLPSSYHRGEDFSWTAI